jgi:hypothetical protein
MSEPASPPPPPPGGGLTPPPPAGGGVPWEERARHGGAVAAFVETVRRLAVEPTAAFAAARRSGELVSPLAYAVVVGWVGVLAQALWALVLGASPLSFLPPEAFAEALAGFAVSGLLLGAILVLVPIWVLVGLFLWGALVHACLFLYGGTRQSESGFEGTLRVLAWSSTAQLAQLAPFFGGFVAFGWSLVLQTMGLAAFHRTSTGKALAAVLTPLALCCFCLVALFGSVIAMVVGAALGGGG